MRVVVGIVFVMHGWQRPFGFGLGDASMLAMIGTVIEVLGGMALLLGLFTRWAAILLAINNGYEFALTLLAANVTLALVGSGDASVDRMLAQRKA